MLSAWLATCFIGAASLAMAAESDDGAAATISVSGSAVLKARPDLAVLGFGVEVEGPTAAQALADNSNRLEAVVETVRKAGIEEANISTAQFTIHPVYERSQDPATGAFSQTLRGYRVSNLLNVETRRLEEVAALVDAAVAAGANRLDRVAYELSAAAREKLDSQLLEQAVDNARARAKQALQPLDYEIVGGLQVAVADPGRPGPALQRAARMELAMDASPPVFAGEQEVRVTVNVTFEISRG
jgi:uncharacterized protein YggE